MSKRTKLKNKARRFVQATHARLKSVFGPWTQLPEDFGAPKRKRLFDPETTFWLFLGQVLGRGVSCREVVRAFLAELWVEQGRAASPNSSAYCKARARLNLCELKQTNRRIVDKVSKETAKWKWLGRRVMVADGSGLSMPDTEGNQAAWPQSKRLLPGCSFPVMRIVALFSLSAGIMIDLAHGAVRPERVAAQFVDVPVVRRRHDAAVRAGGLARDAVSLERVQADGVLGAVGLAQAVGEVDDRAFRKGGLELIGEHALPSDFSHRVSFLAGVWKAPGGTGPALSGRGRVRPPATRPPPCPSGRRRPGREGSSSCPDGAGSRTDDRPRRIPDRIVRRPRDRAPRTCR